MSWVADASDEEASHGDEDHGLGDVEAPLVVAHEAAPLYNLLNVFLLLVIAGLLLCFAYFVFCFVMNALGYTHTR